MRTRPAATCPGWRNAARQRAHPGLYLRGGPRTKTAQTGYHNMVLTLAAGIPSPKGYMWGRTWDLGARRCRGCFHWVTRPGCGAWAARAAAHSGSSSWRGRQRCSRGLPGCPGCCRRKRTAARQGLPVPDGGTRRWACSASARPRALGPSRPARQPQLPSQSQRSMSA